MAPSGTTMALAPAAITLNSQTPAAVNISVTGNVYAADLTLSFDPSSVAIRQILDGGFLSKDGQIVALVQRIDTETGTAHISIERPPNGTAVSGSGSLLTLMLAPGPRKGDSTLRVTDFRLRDARQNVQAGRPAEMRITVQ